MCLDTLDSESLSGLLLEVSDYRREDLYLYGSFELMELFFLADDGMWPNVPKLIIWF